MSDAATEKSRGLRFAEKQLLRHGWEQGKGLGRAENGISEAIRVKVKCDKGGVGHKESEQFTFRWWDHVFNKASANLAVESDQNGVVVKKMEEKEDEIISNKKPRKAMMNKSMLYGCFVKSATLLSGQEQPEETPTLSEDSSSEDDEKLDLSSTTQLSLDEVAQMPLKLHPETLNMELTDMTDDTSLSDAQLMKACGGRTAHKGARHGLRMSAKLARLERQEQEFMAKYGKKTTDKTTTLSQAAPTELSPTRDQQGAETSKRKKGKKTKPGWDEHKENSIQDNGDCSREHNEGKGKKRKERLEDAADSVVEPETKKEKKGKLVHEEESTENVQAEPAEEKKKRKKKKKHSKSSALLEEQSPNAEPANDESANSTESCEQVQHIEGTAVLHPAPDACRKKKKKKKSSKANEDKSPDIISWSSLDTNTAGAVGKEPSQSEKKRKRRGLDPEAATENKSTEKKKKKKKKE